MANRFLDSVGHIGTTTAFLTYKYNSISGSMSISPAFGINGETALVLNFNSSISKTLDNQPTYTVGWNAYFPNAFGGVLLELRDGGTIQVDFAMLPNGTIQIRRGGSTVLGTTTFAVNINTHYYIECNATIHNTTGAAEIRVDGNVKLSLTNVNTRSTTNNYANDFRFRGLMTLYNIYCNDGTGSVNTKYLGDGSVIVVARLPDGAGDSNQWLQPGGGSGATNYQEVDNTPPDVAHYVESSTSTDKDLYHMADVALTGSVRAVQTGVLARTTAGAISITPLIKPSTEHSGASQSLPGSYVYLLDNYDENPATAAAWTVSEVDATQVGMEVD